jgi:dTDP-4-dehydrorhamnose reductase
VLTNDSWLITGASGRLGHQLCRHLVATGHRVAGLIHDRPVELDSVTGLAVDLLDRAAIERAIEGSECSYVVHTAGLTDVDDCEARPDVAESIHVTATSHVAIAARRKGATFIYISTDHLWRGDRAFVDEDRPPQPLNVYALTKHRGELAARAAHPEALILRTNFFGHGRPWRPSFSDWLDARLRQDNRITMFRDVFFTPIAAEILCPLIVEMATRGATGIYHAAGSERLSKYEFGIRYAEIFGHDRARISPASVIDAGLKAPRPNDMSLATEKIERFLGRPMPDCQESLETLRIARAEDLLARH